jgi:Arc/MetJ-type ribon-helix-helix transcriptional regulator
MEREITIQVSDEEARVLQERASAAGYTGAAEYVQALVATALDDDDELLRRIADEIDAALDDPTDRTSLEDTFAELRATVADEKPRRAKSPG